MFLKLKTQGTAAWETIKGMTNDGRGAYLALMADYMGTSVQQLLMKRAETSLNSLVFDGRNRNWTWNRHVAKLRECFHDLRSSGNPLSPVMEVTKLLNTFQCEPLKHLPSMITNGPHRASFNGAVSVITADILSQKMKNGTNGGNRKMAAIDVFDDSGDVVMQDVDSQITSNNRKVKSL